MLFLNTIVDLVSPCLFSFALGCDGQQQSAFREHNKFAPAHWLCFAISVE